MARLRVANGVAASAVVVALMGRAWG